ncbi:MAG: LysM peptidoglycan-binding domain-containing protein [Anaerolineae bacterium]|jgi:nucleoid-associated protein YgaU
MKYVVKSGDTLSKIAEEVYGDANRWREIFRANKDQIDNPSIIRPGWELVIPGVEEEKKEEDDGGQTRIRRPGEKGAEAV